MLLFAGFKIVCKESVTPLNGKVGSFRPRWAFDLRPFSTKPSILIVSKTIRCFFMCGIIGYLGFRPVGQVLYSSLKSLEYRGYDSAGVAVANGATVSVLKDTGKVEEINGKLSLNSITGVAGIAHTRWATHGGVTAANAHPHASCDGKIAVVHNGIVENYSDLRSTLKASGHSFSSQTDTEVIPHLIEDGLKSGLSLEKAVLQACSLLKGSFAFLAVSSDHPGDLVAVRNESPLIVGLGEGEVFAASDALPFLPFTNKAVFLEDGEMAILSAKSSSFFDFRTGKQLMKQTQELKWTAGQAEKGEFEHFMLKEIMEEPVVFKHVALQDEAVLDEFAKGVIDAKKVLVVACGTSYHASLVGRQLFNKLLGKRLDVVLGSEFSFELNSIDSDTLIVAVSQSGETADVLDCVKKAKAKGARIFSFVNVVGSTLDRVSEKVLYLNCGPEVGVASTKAFLSQLGLFYLLAFKASGKLIDMQNLASLVRQSIELNREKLKELARDFKYRDSVYYLGRGVHYPIALEGALKLKEISYLHAEGLASGEMKHGTLALIEKGTPVILLNPKDEFYGDSFNNAMEAKARGARLIAVTNAENENYDVVIRLPACDSIFYPLLEVVPLQLLAYYSAVERGRNPDKPRNLAKSVTVK